MAKDLQHCDGNLKIIHRIFMEKNNSPGYSFKSKKFLGSFCFGFSLPLELCLE